VREEWKKCKRDSPAETKDREEGGGGGAPDAGADIPLQPMEVHGGAGLHLQPMEDPRAGGCLKEAAACVEPTPEQVPGRTCGEEPMREQHCNLRFLLC